MADNKIGGLPVLKGSTLVGIITETDIFRLMLELTGAREDGIRATFLLTDEPGELTKVTNAISEKNGNIIALGTFSGESQMTREIMIKVGRIDESEFKKILTRFALKIKDIRFCCN